MQTNETLTIKHGVDWQARMVHQTWCGLASKNGGQTKEKMKYISGQTWGSTQNWFKLKAKKELGLKR